MLHLVVVTTSNMSTTLVGSTVQVHFVGASQCTSGRLRPLSLAHVSTLLVVQLPQRGHATAGDCGWLDNQSMHHAFDFVKRILCPFLVRGRLAGGWSG